MRTSTPCSRGWGARLRIVPDDIDPGFHLATGAQIVSDPLTVGVTSLTYAGVSRVTGGDRRPNQGGDRDLVHQIGPPSPRRWYCRIGGLAGWADGRRFFPPGEGGAGRISG